LADFFTGGGGGVGEPNERYAVEPEVSVDESDALIEPDAGVRGIELPGGMQWIANGNPAAADEVDVTRKPLDFLRLKIEGVLRNQNQGIGAALDFDGAANIDEDAMAGTYVVAGFLGFEVFHVVIETDMAPSEGFRSFLVVFDVVGLEALVAIMNVYIAVGDEQVAALLLGAARPYFDVAAFTGVKTDLLGNGNG